MSSALRLRCMRHSEIGSSSHFSLQVCACVVLQYQSQSPPRMFPRSGRVPTPFPSISCSKYFRVRATSLNCVVTALMCYVRRSFLEDAVQVLCFRAAAMLAAV